MSARDLARKLRSWALEEGFDRAGIASLEPSQHGEFFADWIARGDHGEMGYLERRRDVRLDPRRILPGARSVLCVATTYYPLDPGGEPAGDLWRRVARYARGRDYHDVMEAGLERLSARILAAYPEAGTRWYVDTGPVLERELAARAGLGSVGKNTNLLDAVGGSWFLLGEIFLTLEMAADLPASDLCGSCTHCLDACPTGALPAPYRLDSRRCISYWTIEHRGPIPREMRPQLGDWVFGCDICQEVCPINADLEPVANEEFQVSASRSSLTLAAVLALEQQEYAERFRGSPLKRAKLRGLQRNVAIAMGNSGRSEYEPPLRHALESEDAMVRLHAAWALGRLGGDAGRPALERALCSEQDEAVREEIETALRGLG